MDHVWPWVTENMKNKTVDKGDHCIYIEGLCLMHDDSDRYNIQIVYLGQYTFYGGYLRIFMFNIYKIDFYIIINMFLFSSPWLISSSFTDSFCFSFAFSGFNVKLKLVNQ